MNESINEYNALIFNLPSYFWLWTAGHHRLKCDFLKLWNFLWLGFLDKLGHLPFESDGQLGCAVNLTSRILSNHLNVTSIGTQGFVNG